jgi:hypothetical protein
MVEGMACTVKSVSEIEVIASSYMLNQVRAIKRLMSEMLPEFSSIYRLKEYHQGSTPQPCRLSNITTAQVISPN